MISSQEQVSLIHPGALKHLKVFLAEISTAVITGCAAGKEKARGLGTCCGKLRRCLGTSSFCNLVMIVLALQWPPRFAPIQESHGPVDVLPC